MSKIIPYAGRAEASAAYAKVMTSAREFGPDAVLAAMAELGRRDVFFMLIHMLRRADADNDFVFARCKEVAANPDGYLDLWAREHYKSTVITFALTIQDVVCDPEITVGIFSHTRPIAKGFLKQIKREFEENDILKSCYADVLYADPQREAPQWSEDGGLIVRRKSNPKEATLEAWGLVDGQPTGRHFSLLVYDDVVTLESVTSPEMIAKVTERWAVSLNLGTEGGKRRHIGTRYHFNDTYKIIMERGAAVPRVHAATADGKPEGEPLHLSREALADKRRDMGPYVFGCQMLQNPVADSVMGFKREWFQTCPEDIAWQGMNRYILVDPASSKKKGSDYTAMWVIGLGQDQNYYVLDGVRDRLNLTERADALFRLHRRYAPLAVGYEKYGQQADIEHIQERMGREGYRFTITPLGGMTAKEDRIRRLIPDFEAGRVVFRQRIMVIDSEGRAHNLTQEFLDQEFEAFPVAIHDDMFDCLARIVEPEFPANFPRVATGIARRAVSNFEESFFG